MRRLLSLPLLLLALVLLSCPSAWAQSEVAAVIATVQTTFDAMAAHDGGTLIRIFLPEASLVAAMPDGQRRILRGDDFIKRTVSAGEPILERMWNPKVTLDGDIATLLAPYDFYRSGKRTHCGIDAVTLLKAEGQWRISHIAFTIQTQNCPESPLGPPKF